MKQFTTILVCLWFWLTVRAIVNVESVEEKLILQPTETLTQPIETYHLSFPGEGRREIKINPPATKIVVTSQSGDTIILCGDGQNAYSCAPGKRLELEYEATKPVAKFWGENLNDTQVRLQIDVYKTVPIDNSYA